LIMNYREVLAGIFSKPKIADGSSTHRSGELNRIVGEVKKLPRETWPLVKSHWCQTKSFDAIARYFQALPSSAGAVANGPAEEHVLRNLPLIVLSAGNSSAVQRAEHEALAQSSSCGRLEVVSDSGHWMHFDRPDVVVRAVQDMVSLCRERATREA
jgi:pimeloyl-ACP methyl ester carboxylesterase